MIGKEETNPSKGQETTAERVLLIHKMNERFYEVEQLDTGTSCVS